MVFFLAFNLKNEKKNQAKKLIDIERKEEKCIGMSFVL